MYSNNSQSCGNLHRDRFELLSAYIDHEVTADERRQVETWIAEDPDFAKMHRRITKLQLGFQQIPAPAPAEHPDVAIAQVLKKVEWTLPNWKVLAGIGGAIATVSTLAVLSFAPRGFAPELASQPTNTITPTSQIQPPTPSDLMIALDQPTYVATKTSVADNRNNAQ